VGDANKGNRGDVESAATLEVGRFQHFTLSVGEMSLPFIESLNGIVIFVIH